MARKFDVQKNNEPLYWSIGFLILAIWCFRDGWYPPESKIEEYPKFPEDIWSLAWGYKFYGFNRVSALLSGIASLFMGGVYFVINRT